MLVFEKKKKKIWFIHASFSYFLYFTERKPSGQLDIDSVLKNIVYSIRPKRKMKEFQYAMTEK